MKRTHCSTIFSVYFVLLVCVAFSGCITPQVSVAPGTDLAQYRKVYLVPSNGDPRNITPRVLARLKQTGFDVIEINSNSPAIDSQGSGFVLTSEGYILTCAHVIEKETNATVWIDGLRYLCRVLTSDTNTDLAILLVEGPHQPFHPLAFASRTNYAMGEDVYTMGFPLAGVLGTAPRLNKGMISATVGLDDDPKFVQVSAPVQPGNSGGPLLNQQGETIGVVSATLNPLKIFMQSGGALPQNVNFAIKSEIVRKFLSGANITIPSPAAENSTDTFETAQKSLALVRLGNVTDEDLKRPAMICYFGYYSIFDMWWRFRSIVIQFSDLKKGSPIFEAGQYQDDPFSSENAELDRLFADISARFFPDKPNPFKGKK